MRNGGLRTKGITKKTTKTKPLITIVTVVFNGEKKLEKTIQSVLCQKYENLEYIIIDGASCDGTLDIIKKYEDKIDFWKSEPDTGIYDAMNKGIYEATGDWINFMNSGDVFASDSVLLNCFDDKDYSDIDVIYGNSIEVSNEIEIPIIAIDNLKKLNYRPIFRHNAAFFKSVVQQENTFKIGRKDLGYSLDYKCIYDIYQQKRVFKRVPFFIVKYEKEGISNNQIKNIIFNYRITKEVTPFISFVIFLYRLIVFSLKNIMSKVGK